MRAKRVKDEKRMLAMQGRLLERGRPLEKDGHRPQFISPCLLITKPRNTLLKWEGGAVHQLPA